MVGRSNFVGDFFKIVHIEECFFFFFHHQAYQVVARMLQRLQVAKLNKVQLDYPPFLHQTTTVYGKLKNHQILPQVKINKPLSVQNVETVTT